MVRGWPTNGLVANLKRFEGYGFDGFKEGRIPKVDPAMLTSLQHFLQNVKALDGKLNFATKPLCAALLQWFSKAKRTQDFDGVYANIEAAAADYGHWLGDYVLGDVAWEDEYEKEIAGYMGSDWFGVGGGETFVNKFKEYVPEKDAKDCALEPSDETTGKDSSPEGLRDCSTCSDDLFKALKNVETMMATRDVPPEAQSRVDALLGKALDILRECNGSAKRARTK